MKLKDLLDAGLSVTMDGNKMKVAPAAKITEAIRKGIRENREEIAQEVLATHYRGIETVPGEPDWTIHGSALAKWWTYEDLLKETLEFCNSLDATDYDGVVGIPRSGVLCASVAAQKLGLPLWSVDASNRVTRLASGLRRAGSASVEKPRLLVLEDSSASGYSIEQARHIFNGYDTTWGAILVTQAASKRLDVFHRVVQLPHWFEWNLYGNSHLVEGVRIGTDFDGILCPDFTAEEDDDAWRYVERMKTMECLIPKGSHFHAIITARLEKYRVLTEHWLKKNEITTDHLVMGPWATRDQRSQRCMGSYKWTQARKLGVGMFIESCPLQTQVFASKGGIPVICPELGGTYVK